MTAKGDTDTVIEKQVEVVAPPKLRTPDMFDLIMYNDDITPMEFVVAVLTQVLQLAQDTAVELMLSVHNSGKAICGTYVEEVAMDYRDRITDAAVRHRYPLHCEVQPSASGQNEAE